MKSFQDVLSIYLLSGMYRGVKELPLIGSRVLFSLFVFGLGSNGWYPTHFGRRETKQHITSVQKKRLHEINKLSTVQPPVGRSCFSVTTGFTNVYERILTGSNSFTFS